MRQPIYLRSSCTYSEFKIFEVDTMKTVKQMIEYVLGAGPSEGDKCNGWAASECIEVGDGTFIKVSNVRVVVSL
jgi:hypothetical protein